MQHVRHALPAALIAAALAAGTAACGSPVPGSAYATGTAASQMASPDPLAGLTGDQITRQAIADLNAAKSVRIAGTGTESGQAIGLALTLVRGKGCQGSLSLRGKGSLQIVYNRKSIWMLPSDSLYKSRGVSTAMISLLSGKWLKLGKISELGDVSSFCSLNAIVSQMSRQSAGMTKGAVTTVDGQGAVAIHQTGYSGTVYISDMSKPEFLKMDIQGANTGSITFSGYGRHATITPPPASKTLNEGGLGSQIAPITI